MISIIIPHYNDVNGLKKLLNSIPDLNIIQIVIVDDHSEIDFANLKKFVVKLNKKNIEIYLNNNPRSAGSCRNIGLKHALGEWILFADSDDFFVEDAFDTILKLIERNENIIYFRPISINLPEGVTGNRHLPYERLVLDYLRNKNEGTEIALKSGFIVPWSKMYKREFLIKNHILFDEVRWSNDVMFSVQSAFCADSILAVDREIYCVTRNKGTLTTQKNEEEYKTRLEVYIRKYKYLSSMLAKEKLKYAINMPAGKVFKAILLGYGTNMVKHILHRYREEHIPLFYSGVGTIKNVLSDRKRHQGDKRYYME